MGIQDNNKELIGKEDIKSELREFKKFAIKKNILELAVGVVLAAAFTKLVNAISECLIMPVVNLVISQTGDKWREWTISLLEVKFEIGRMLGTTLDFLITAIVLYIIYKKLIYTFLRHEEKAEALGKK